LTVERLLSTISSAEFVEWMAFDAIDPIGEDRADLRAGMIAAAVCNAPYYKLKKRAQASDFMPYRDTEALMRSLEPEPALPAPEEIDREAQATAIKNLFIAAAGPLKTGAKE
jgi:hypothetical protein